MKSLVRRVTLILILCAVLVPGLAQAGPRISTAEPVAGALALLWDVLFGWAKNGPELDPNGRTAPSPGIPSDLGPGLDPSGAPQSDLGAGLDPADRP